MSWSEPDRECRSCVEAAAFVLGALGDEEHAYRAHLSACAICQAEVAELRLVVNAVPSTAPPVPASDALRERVMAVVRSEAELLNAAGPAADRAPRRLRWRPATSVVAAASALATVAVIAILLISPSGQTVRTMRATIAFASAPAGAHATLRELGDRGELVVSGIPQAPPGKTYEVWVQRVNGAPIPTDALFTVSSRGIGSVDVPGSLSGVREVLVSAEPLGGSARLTGPVLIRVTVSS